MSRLSLMVALFALWATVALAEDFRHQSAAFWTTLSLLFLALVEWLLMGSYWWWGLKLEVDGDGSERLLSISRSTPHAVAKLRSRWPFYRMDGIRIRLHTRDQPELDTTIMSEDGKYDYAGIDGACCLPPGERAGLVPLAYRMGGDNRAYLGDPLGDGKAIHENGLTQDIEVVVMRGRATITRRWFTVKAVQRELRVDTSL